MSRAAMSMVRASQDRTVLFRFAEVSFEKADHMRVELFVDVRVRDHMREAGEGEEFEVFACAEEFVCKLQRMAEIDVVVGGAMNKQEGSLKIFCKRQQR